MKNNIRILCISPQFVPRSDSEAFCSAKMCQALLSHGIDVNIIYNDNDIQYYDNSKIWDSLKAVSTCVPGAKKKNTIRSISCGLRFRTVSWARWVDDVVNMAKSLHKIRNFNYVYSRSLPAGAHIAGFWCARHLRLPWIANINDPWDYYLFPNGSKKDVSFVYASMTEYWMRRTFRDASLITYPTSRLGEYHIGLSGVVHKYEVIPHIGCAIKDESGCKGFNIVHAGKLGINEVTGRSTSGLLKGLKQFIEKHPEVKKDVRLILVGPEDKGTSDLVCSYGLNNNVDVVGRVSYETSLKYINSSTVCVLVEGETTDGIYLPSKMVDYIAAQKPVIALSPKKGAVADMLPDAGLIRVDSNDCSSIADAISAYYIDYTKGNIHARSPSINLMRRYSAYEVANKFISALAKI